ncbi:hypothetical protein PPL_00378 [Heterostelium album PN500]|uniref:Uncharacterized protein n=1 Tax=Heterostelium pallidum (strain ATCC 26659 / Pp 5 / PN500) TaxID=670386 RepID=D3AWA4_HETP5|nr:hypothetical protein PPL_00378 [Heterostelium album PN500]EFA86577.1 hypothetical protein PPL_00378 [Heterostelium album PN500]|eukprot:XP_020438682.1 hypothetical protein PPL_00378 [Heterostelium album PN500]
MKLQNVPYNTYPTNVFLILGGEGPIVPEMTRRMPFISVANESKALVIALELRYYGKSIPVPDLSTDNLMYLSTDQILEDIAEFQIEFSRQFGLTEAKWIVMGCSYAGTLAAWYRMKYPHMVGAAISSSAPLKAVTRFDAYDKKVRAALGPKCSSAFKSLFDHIEYELMELKNQSIKDVFSCNRSIDDRMFLFMLSESLSYSVQYNSKFKLLANICPLFIKHSNNMSALLDMFIGYIKNMFLFQGTTCDDYNIFTYANTEIDYSGTRQWTWQMCSEYGWFLVASEKNVTLKSSLLNETWWQNEVCRILFGRPMKPFVEKINLLYGPDNIKQLSSVLYTNGDLDPWSTLSVSTSCDAPISNILNIAGESHCANWYGETQEDSWDLKNARLLGNAFLRQFIKSDCKRDQCERKGGICLPKKDTERTASSMCVFPDVRCSGNNRYFSKLDLDDNTITNITYVDPAETNNTTNDPNGFDSDPPTSSAASATFQINAGVDTIFFPFQCPTFITLFSIISLIQLI